MNDQVQPGGSSAPPFRTRTETRATVRYQYLPRLAIVQLMDYDLVKERVFAGAGLGYALISQAAHEDPEASVSDLNQYSGIIRFGGTETLALGFWRHEGALGAAWVDDKFLTSSTLRSLGLPTPHSVCVTSAGELEEAISAIGFPAVVKPRNGSRGEGVTVNIESFHDLELAFQSAASHSDSVVIEEHIDVSEELRILASDDHCFGVVRRTLPKVIGDGQHTISQLIDLRNTERSTNPTVYNKLIPKDSIVEKTLTASGYTLSDIPDKGTEIVVRNIGGLSSGGDSEDYTAQTPKHVKSLSTQVVRAIPGLHWAGIDVAIERETGKPWIIEANINAGYSLEYPSTGQRREITPDLWKIRKADAAARALLAQKFEASYDGSRQDSADEYNRYLAGSRRRRLSSLYSTYLTRHGYEVVQASPSVFEAYNNADLVLRYTRSFRTADDLAIVNRFLKSHFLVRKIFQIKNIPRPKALLPSGSKSVDSLLPGIGKNVWAIPARAPWASPRSKIISSDDSLVKSGTISGYYLQAALEDRVSGLSQPVTAPLLF